MSSNTTGPKHILYLIDELKVKGGTEKHLYELATGMAAAGLRVTVFALAEGAYADEFRQAGSISYDCLSVTRIYDWKGFSAVLKIAGYIRKHKVDIVQSFHTASDLMAPLAACLSLWRPKVFSSRRDLGYTKSPRHIAMQRRINCLVDGILANSRAVKQSVQEQEGFPADRITVIYNGISIEPFAKNDAARQQERLMLGANRTAVLIGSVGNIRPVKGFDLLVEAAGFVCQEMPHVRFCHAGEGEQRDQLMARCRQLGIEDNFVFLGTVSDIPAFLNALDIYIQPSRSEGLSNAILEAMATGLPVVATDVGGNPDLIESGINGVLVQLAPAEMAAQLLKLVTQPEKRLKLGAAAYQKVLDKFQLSTSIREYLDFYSGDGQ